MRNVKTQEILVSTVSKFCFEDETTFTKDLIETFCAHLGWVVTPASGKQRLKDLVKVYVPSAVASAIVYNLAEYTLTNSKPDRDEVKHSISCLDDFAHVLVEELQAAK